MRAGADGAVSRARRHGAPTSDTRFTRRGASWRRRLRRAQPRYRRATRTSRGFDIPNRESDQGLPAGDAVRTGGAGQPLAERSDSRAQDRQGAGQRTAAEPARRHRDHAARRGVAHGDDQRQYRDEPAPGQSGDSPDVAKNGIAWSDAHEDSRQELPALPERGEG